MGSTDDSAGGFSYRIEFSFPGQVAHVRDALSMAHQLVEDVRHKLKEATMAARIDPGAQAVELIRSINAEIAAARRVQRTMAGHMIDMGVTPFDDEPSPEHIKHLEAEVAWLRERLADKTEEARFREAIIARIAPVVPRAAPRRFRPWWRWLSGWA